MTARTFQSLAQAVEAYYEELRVFVLLRARSPSLADDVLQETWLRASTSGAAMPENPRAYLYRMVGNLLVDHVRKHGSEAHASAEVELAERLPSPDPTPDAVVGARQELAILAQAVDELPAQCRRVFLLYRGQGLTMRQVALRLGISQKTVEKHIARAMVHCRQRIRAAGRTV